MPLEKVRRWLSREHRALRKEVIETFRKHGIRIKGRDLLGYKKEELITLKDKLSELEAKHGIRLDDLVGRETGHGFAPFGWDRDRLVRNRVSEKVLPKFIDEYVKDTAKKIAQEIVSLAPEVQKIKEIDYNGHRIKVSTREIARFLQEHGLKHAEGIRNRLIEEVVKLRSRTEARREEALTIIDQAKKAGVRGVRVGDRRILLEEIEEGVKKGSVYAYMDAIRALEAAIQKSQKRKRKVKAREIGRFISIWMPRGREPAPVVSKDLVHVLEKTKEIAAELEKAYRKISAYDVSHIGHANAAEAIYTALHENPEDILRGMVEALNESLYGNPRARIEKYEIRGPESVFSTIEKNIGQVIKKEIENLSEMAAKQPEAAIKKMKEQRAHQIGRQLASVLLKMHELGHVHITPVAR